MTESEDREIRLTTQQLSQYPTSAEKKNLMPKLGYKKAFPSGARKHQRTVTPPETMASDDEGEYVEQEEKAARCMSADDPDYEDV